MTDTQRKDMVGCYGDKRVNTPNLDKLADEGIRFERAYTTQPLCQPARAGIFTGAYPRSCSSWANGMGLSDNVQNIGRRLTDNGVHCAYIGKWHLDGSDYFGLGKSADGFDEKYWYDMRNYLEELTYEERLLSRDGASFEKHDIKEEFTFGHRCSQRAIDFIKNHKNEDYFLVVSYDEPHGPSLCPTRFLENLKDYEVPIKDSFYDDLEDKPEHHKLWSGTGYINVKDKKFCIKPTKFFGCNSFADYEIGRVLDVIKEEAEDAIIMYTSDHGDMLNSHTLWNKGPAMYDDITNIPFIVKGFGKGEVNNNIVSHINIAPTIFDIFGINKPKVFEGVSILEELKTGKRTNKYIFMEYGRYEVGHDKFGGFQPIRAIFDGRYKLIINLLTTDEFYDLDKDPQEMKNLINDKNLQHIKEELHESLMINMNETMDPFRGYYWEDRHWNNNTKYKNWENRGMIRQRENEEYEKRQLDYSTGLTMKEAVRKK